MSALLNPTTSVNAIWQCWIKNYTFLDRLFQFLDFPYVTFYISMMWVLRFLLIPGVSFETSYDALIGQIPLGLNVFAHSVEQYLKVANRWGM